MSSGGRNLIILGILAAGITCATCGVSLYLYHASGDIYIDRSRPGFLPDSEEDPSSTPANSYKFSETGPVTSDAVDEYLENLENELNKLENIKDPYSATPLSDAALGIPAK